MKNGKSFIFFTMSPISTNLCIRSEKANIHSVQNLQNPFWYAHCRSPGSAACLNTTIFICRKAIKIKGIRLWLSAKQPTLLADTSAKSNGRA